MFVAGGTGGGEGAPTRDLSAAIFQQQLATLTRDCAKCRIKQGHSACKSLKQCKQWACANAAARCVNDRLGRNSFSCISFPSSVSGCTQTETDCLDCSRFGGCRSSSSSSSSRRNRRAGRRHRHSNSKNSDFTCGGKKDSKPSVQQQVAAAVVAPVA